MILSVDAIVLEFLDMGLAFSPRLLLLWDMAYEEEGLEPRALTDIEQRSEVCVFPRSFVDRVGRLHCNKKYDFCFRGSINSDRKTMHNRQWGLQFARERFTSNSYFQATDTSSVESVAEALGSFGFTGKKTGFVPKENPRERRAYFDEEYFLVLRQSEFTLCPAGDAPWSMRFFEAILSGSIPILEKVRHSGRNHIERGLGYTYSLSSDVDFVFDPAVARKNYLKFIESQTLF